MKQTTKKPKESTPSMVVFCDTKNQKLDEVYAEQLRAEFRKQTGWKVLPDTRIFNELTAFSKGYSVTKRNVVEVAVIFRIANGLMNVNPTPKRSRKSAKR